MTIVESEKKPLREKDQERPRIAVAPNYSAFLKKDTFVIEVALPGVAKEKIKMRVLEDFITLRAERDNIVFTLDLDINFKVEPKEVISKYTEGLLHVEFKRYNPLEHAYAVMERKSDENEEIKYKIYPNIYRHVDYKNREVRVELSLPGVKEEDITLKVLPMWFHLEALRADDMSIAYTANANFGCEIVPEKTTVEYFSGLLRITAHVRNPLDEAKVIKFEKR